jgi:hypothetical protein
MHARLTLPEVCVDLDELLSGYINSGFAKADEPTSGTGVTGKSESGRQSCLKMDFFSGDGVLEFQKLGVQQISSIAGETGEIFKRLTVYAVQRIANQGMADGCQMDSDLMRAARI